MSKIIILKAINEVVEIVTPTHKTKGTYLEILVTLPNKEAGPLHHMHPKQSKEFFVIDGCLVIDKINSKTILNPGDSFLVMPNTFHTCYPVGNSKATFKIKYTPALSFEYFITSMFESCNRNKSRHASIFEVSYIMQQTLEEFFIYRYPIFIQRLIFPIIGKIGKSLGLVKTPPKKHFY